MNSMLDDSFERTVYFDNSGKVNNSLCGGKLDESLTYSPIDKENESFNSWLRKRGTESDEEDHEETMSLGAPTGLSLAAELEAIREEEDTDPEGFSLSMDHADEMDGDHEEETKLDEVFVTPYISNERKMIDRTKRRASIGPGTAGWRLKYDSAIQQIGHLQTTNEKLQDEVSKLKLSLALREAECMTMQEPLAGSRYCKSSAQVNKSNNISTNENTAPTNAVTTVVVKDKDSSKEKRKRLANSAPLKLTEKKLDTADTKKDSSSRPPLVPRKEPTPKAPVPQSNLGARTVDFAELFHDLIESESFQLVGSGESVLDQLSEQCRRDVVIRYCDLLEALSGEMDY